ncbi:DUF5123 domain-containing protein [Pontibacter sp. 13R65]|uniref:DUF5123 domain-containing protein n=1 Tax=Pontibacter sp. 13R65 TaxID=3127458 RepID=UPI00301D9D4F
MIKNYCNFFKGAGLLAFLLVFLQHNANAQATHRVSNAEIDGLKTFLLDKTLYAAGDIVMLESEGVYELTTTVDLPQSVTIMGDPALATRPVIRFTGTSGSFRALENNILVSFKGVDFNGYQSNNTSRTDYIFRGAATAVTDPAGGLATTFDKISIEDSKAWGFKGGIMLNNNGLRVRCKEFVLNNVDWSDMIGAYAVNLNQNAVENLRIANSTFHNISQGFINNPYFSDATASTPRTLVVPQTLLIENNTFYKISNNSGSFIQVNDPKDGSVTMTFRNNIVSTLYVNTGRPFRIDPFAGTFQFTNNLFHEFNTVTEANSKTNLDAVDKEQTNVTVTSPVTEDPGFADPEKGDFTLAAGSPAIAVGGDPQWLPAVEAREHRISNAEENALKTFIENTSLWNPGDIIVLSGDYTEIGYINITQDITIVGDSEGDSRPLITFHGGGFRPAADGLSITLKGFDINGKTMDAENKEVRAMIIDYGRDNAFGAELIHIEDMHAYGLSNGVELYFNQGRTYEKIVINNVVWHDITNWVFNPRMNAVKDVMITNSTFYNAGGGIFNPYFTNNNRPQVIQQKIVVSHNTFYDLGNANRGLFQINDSRDGSVTLTFTDNIVSTIKQPENSRPFNLHAEAGTFTLTNNVIHNFDATDEGKKQFNYVEIGKLSNVTTDNQPKTDDPGFANAAEGDFTLPAGTALLTAGTDGGLIGDPRWNPGNVTSTDPELAVAKIEVYPNPVKDILYINSPAAVEVTIYNISGSVVMKGSINRIGSINIAALKSGLYIARIDSGSKVQSVKLIKE